MFLINVCSHMPDKHLKPYQHYADLYDKFTVQECRDLERITYSKPLPQVEGKEFSKEEEKTLLDYINNLQLFFVKGERYLKKEQTIQKWMDDDKKIDQFVESAKAPEDICCLACGRLAFVSTSNLDISFRGEPHRMLYFYDCPLGHLPRRAFYNTGEEFKSKSNLCPKCNSNLNDESERKKNKIITTYSCPKCGYSEKDVLELHAKDKPEKIDPNYSKDRDRFCLSDKEGQEYAESKVRLESLSTLMKEIDEREKNKVSYDKVAQLKKLTIIELEKLLTPVLEKAQYVKFHMKDPENGRDIFVPFIVYDAKADRVEWHSKHDLEKLLKKTLENSNWRLMSDGVSYRLGILEGRLRAFEREEDLLKLVK